MNRSTSLRAELLEDRLTPAGAADVLGALQRAGSFRDALGFISGSTATLFSAQLQPLSKAFAADIFQQSTADFDTLAGFFAAIQAEMASNPALAPTLMPYLGRVGAAEFQAQANVVNADFLQGALAVAGTFPPAGTTGTTGTTTTGTTTGTTGANGVGGTTSLNTGTNATTNLGLTQTNATQLLNGTNQVGTTGTGLTTTGTTGTTGTLTGTTGTTTGATGTTGITGR